MNIRIFGIDYPIVFEKEIRDENDQKLLGEIKYTHPAIVLCENMGAQVMFHVLWHEIVHGLINSLPLPDMSEEQVDAMAHGIVQVLRDNQDDLAALYPEAWK